MPQGPLTPPREQESLSLLLKQFDLRADKEPRQLLRDVATAFATLPYESLTKIIKGHKLADPTQSRRAVLTALNVAKYAITNSSGGSRPKLASIRKSRRVR